MEEEKMTEHMHFKIGAKKKMELWKLSKRIKKSFSSASRILLDVGIRHFEYDIRNGKRDKPVSELEINYHKKGVKDGSRNNQD